MWPSSRVSSTAFRAPQTQPESETPAPYNTVEETMNAKKRINDQPSGRSHFIRQESHLATIAGFRMINGASPTARIGRLSLTSMPTRRWLGLRRCSPPTSSDHVLSQG